MKKLPLLLSLAFLTAACSKTIKEIHSPPPTVSNAEAVAIKEDNLQLLNRILSSDAPNLALAELLTKTLSPAEKAAVTEIVMRLSAEEISQFLTQIEKENKTIRNQYLYHGMAYQVNEKFLGNTLLELDERVATSLPLEEQIKISVFTYVKNKTLDSIIETYENRSSVLANELAEQIALDISLEPKIAQKIEEAVRNNNKYQAIEVIAKAEPVIKKLNIYFKSSDLNQNEQYTVIGTGIILGALYMSVKENGDFKKIVGKAQRLIKDAKELEEKTKELVALSHALKDHFDSVENNIKNLSDGLKGSQEDIRGMYDTAKRAMNGPSNIHSKRLVDFFYNKVIKGKDVKADGANQSILDQQVRINKNVEKSINAAGAIADNLGNLINTTNTVLNRFGIKPSNDVQRALKTAKKVADTVSTVRNITMGFAAGGPLGALAALGSSPLLASALGGGGDATAAALKQINRKLDIILENQQKMMEIQLETMKMIKDLALVLDQYHQREMMALSELRDFTLVNLEINKALLNKEIRSCERMINYQLSSVWKDQDFKMDTFYGMNDLKIINSRFANNISSLNDIRRIINSVEANGFEKCQNGIVEAFGGNSVAENPLRSLFSSSDNENLLRFQRETYAPLLEVLYRLAETTRLGSVPLHLPSKSFRAVEDKSRYLMEAKNSLDNDDDVYELEDLISTKGLERYLSQLLILHPFLEVDKEIWHQDHASIVTTYLENSNTNSNQNIRSHYFLTNALKLVQSAIAQEALLAGEPLLPVLFESHKKELLSPKSCSELTLGNLANACSIRKNKLLMKNFVAYILFIRSQRFHQDSFLTQYTSAYNSARMDVVAHLMDAELGAPNFTYKLVDGARALYLVLPDSGAIRLPTPEELSKGLLIYSENMPHLLQMQKAIIENLEKVAPLQRANGNSDLMKLLLVERKIEGK